MPSYTNRLHGLQGEVVVVGCRRVKSPKLHLLPNPRQPPLVQAPRLQNSRLLFLPSSSSPLFKNQILWGDRGTAWPVGQSLLPTSTQTTTPSHHLHGGVQVCLLGTDVATEELLGVSSGLVCRCLVACPGVAAAFCMASRVCWGYIFADKLINRVQCHIVPHIIVSLASAPARDVFLLAQASVLLLFHSSCFLLPLPPHQHKQMPSDRPTTETPPHHHHIGVSVCWSKNNVTTVDRVSGVVSRVAASFGLSRGCCISE